jgi:predicted Rdx family selenoprotein
MATPEHEVVFCPECGAVLAAFQELLDAKSEAIADLHQQNIGLLAKVSRLRGEQLDKRKSDPRFEDAQAILELWRELLSPKARDLNGKRLENVLARLKKTPHSKDGYVVEELMWSIRGYALKPYVVNGRRTATGTADDWHADAELIFRDAGKVDQGIRWWKAHQAMEETLSSVPAPPAQPHVTADAFSERIAQYASVLGFAVFPCQTGAKTPATPHGFQDATKDLDRIRRCWTRRPDLNVAIATGAVSGIVVLDIDDYKGGGDSLIELEKRYGALPVTMSATTPRGGQHYYFRHPGQFVPNAVDLVPGIDVRGDGGYVLLPPSIVDGKPYEWDDRQAVAALPEWLMQGMTKARHNARRPEYWIKLAEGVTAGERNQKMTEIVGLMAGAGLPDDLVAVLALAVNKRFKPPMADREVATVVRSITTRHRTKAAA